MTSKPTAGKSHPLFPILLVNFIDTLGFSIVLPFLVIIVLQFGGGEMIYGFISATYSFFQLIGAPALGALSDKYGRKKILLISEIGTFVGWAIFLVAMLLYGAGITYGQGMALISVPLILLFLSRAVVGLTGGNISVANAYLADISTKAQRKNNFGKMTVVGNFGLVIGPALAGVLGASVLGNIVPVIAALFISFTAVIVIQVQLKNVRPKQASGRSERVVPGTIKEGRFFIFRLKNVPLMMLLYFLIYMAFNFFYVAFPLYVAAQLKWTVLQIGIFFSVLSGLLVIQAPFLSWISSRISSAILVISGCLVLAGGFALFQFSSTVLIYAGAVLYAVGNGVMWPSFLTVLSNVADDKYQGAVQGFAGSAGSLASIIGLISGAFIYKLVGTGVFNIATVLMVLIACLSFKLMTIEKKNSDN